MSLNFPTCTWQQINYLVANTLHEWNEYLEMSLEISGRFRDMPSVYSCLSFDTKICLRIVKRNIFFSVIMACSYMSHLDSWQVIKMLHPLFTAFQLDKWKQWRRRIHSFDFQLAKSRKEFAISFVHSLESYLALLVKSPN